MVVFSTHIDFIGAMLYSRSRRHRRYSDDDDEDVLPPMGKSKLRDDEDDNDVRIPIRQLHKRDDGDDGDGDAFVPVRSTRREAKRQTIMMTTIFAKE